MPDRPTEAADSTSIDALEGGARSLSEILEELSLLSHAQAGDASEMRSAVSELSRALARLFEMIRADRTDQRVRIAELEREVEAARAQLKALGVEPQAAPAPNDFDQLRAAAERLRLRTQQLVRDAHLAPPVASTPADGVVIENEVVGSGLADRVIAAPAAPAPLEPQATETPAAEDATAAAVAEAAAAPLGEPGVLRVFPGGAAAEDVPVESELEIDEPQALAARAPVPVEAPAAPIPAIEEPAVLADEPARDAAGAQPVGSRQEPIAVGPATAARRGRLRRRRIDARKLREVEPTTALTTLVSAIDPLWTAGCPIDLVVAFTDGGAVHVAGGDRAPLAVREVAPGTAARCTITATRRQVVPLLGRLELTGEESAPLIHGTRRDADLLVGWLDRAQRLPVRPL